MIANRNIVVKREGNKLLLPTVDYREVDAPAGTPVKAFLMCRIMAYDPDSETLNLKWLSDLVNDRSFKIAIEENSEVLLPLSIKKIVFNQRPTFFTNPWVDKPDFKSKKFNNPPEIIHHKELVRKENIAEKLDVRQKVNILLHLPVKDLKFSHGKVSFEYYINQLNRKFTFDINHPFIKQEYDSIKNYFPKVLKIDKFSISLQYEYLAKEIVSYNLSAPEILKIDESLFELVEELYIEEHIVNRPDDDIYSINQIAAESAIKIGSDKIKDTEWLLNNLITKERTKHYYHLRYLSDKHLPDIFHLKLTGKPLSFIFLLPFQNDYCLVWETYSTEEATYAWRINSTPNLKTANYFQEFIDRIKWLRGNNKMAYLRERSLLIL